MKGYQADIEPSNHTTEDINNYINSWSANNLAPDYRWQLNRYRRWLHQFIAASWSRTLDVAVANKGRLSFLKLLGLD